MTTLTRELRRLLESTVREARRIAEAGALKAIEQLAVAHHEPWPRMTPAQRELRNRLRAHGRQLGDRRDDQRGSQAVDRLKAECAYEHWHRLLFARFLAETELLIEPQSGIAITLSECEELARGAGRDWLEVAAEYAQRMLPQIFRSGDPVLEVTLPPETRSAIEDLMKALPRDVFVADDSLGWVYQFWQADRKDEVNRSQKKIGAEELPAVTQLFTEDYMVLFLLHNTLGAWWAGKVLSGNPSLPASAADEDELRAACAVGEIGWAYLRFVRDDGKPWRPAAGTFDGWPKVAKDITLLDPCMGSGHFLVFALPMVAAMRAAEESMSPEAAIEAVLRDNLFGLEIDPRCTQIAAFNLALAAWRRTGYRQLPTLHLACSGLSLGVTKTEWFKLAERAAQALPVPPKADLLGTEENLFSDAMKRGFERLYDLFVRAPWLGSLIEPRVAGGDLIEQSFADLEPVLALVMARAGSAELAEMAVAAQGLAKASQILARQFTLVSTNVPYLGREGHSDILTDFANVYFQEGAADLATLFLRRCVGFLRPQSTICVVVPQNWWVGRAYRDVRKWMLCHTSWAVAVVLGEEAWWTFGNRGPNTVLLIADNVDCKEGGSFHGIDVSTKPGSQVVSLETKARALAGLGGPADDPALSAITTVDQARLLKGREARVSLAAMTDAGRLAGFVDAGEGCSTGDGDRFSRKFWEINDFGAWIPFCGPGYGHWAYCDTSLCIHWENGEGELARSAQARIQNTSLWKRHGVLIGRVRGITATLFAGGAFSKGAVLVSPRNPEHLPALYAYLSSREYEHLVRSIDPRVSAATSVLTDVPFDIARWANVAATSFPDGLPSASESDSTQLTFNGHPRGAQSPLQVAVARLVGYRWPRQLGFRLAGLPQLESDGLEDHADKDGIVAIYPIKGELSAASRLSALLADGFGPDWSAARLNALLAETGFAGRQLNEWLLDGFFEQHCERYQHRPFVWHVWDGRRDGFHALVNYHRLAGPNGEGRRTLEKLIYSYLGDWIDRQRIEQKTGVEGADARIAAAEHLRTELTNILVGETPYDIFVRWKPLHRQPLGWEPEIGDGVPINIRPFTTAKPLGARAKGACILRVTPQIKWGKDGGKERSRSLEDFPWFWGWDEQTTDFEGRGNTPDGNRWNDLHYTRVFKEAARARKAEAGSMKETL